MAADLLLCPLFAIVFGRSSQVLERSVQGNVLLVKPAYEEGWDIPGGYVEPGETPVEACRREVKEELGLEVHLRRLLVVDWAPSESEGDKVLFVFDGGTIDHATEEQLRLPNDEADVVRFPTARSFRRPDARGLARRIHAAVSVRESVDLNYLEHGLAEWKNSD